MKKQVWKFELLPECSINMPVGAEILAVQAQGETPCIWALVDPRNPLEERIFETFGTGHRIHYDIGVERKYIGTFQLHGGDLVFHAFERIS